MASKYFYPDELRADIFKCEKAELDRIDFEADPFEYHGIRTSKRELAQLVVDRMTVDHELHQEVTALISRIRAACK
jgi:hypothetical protein